jgi:hypothetical protein
LIDDRYVRHKAVVAVELATLFEGDEIPALLAIEQQHPVPVLE